MINVAIFALSNDNARDALICLEDEKVINIKAWLGEGNGNKIISHEYEKLLSNEFLNQQYELCDEKIYSEVYKKLYIFLDMFARNYEVPIYEGVNIFNILVNFYYTLFKKNEIEVAIWGDIPHFGIDSIAKNVADAMGIKTVMFMQSSMPNKFWSFSCISDIGIFETLKNVNIENVNIERKYEKDLFYMKDINKKVKMNISKKIYLFMSNVNISLIKSVIKLRKLLLCKEKDIYNKIILKLYTILHKKIRYLYCKKLYNINLNKYFSKIKIEDAYVYFPLHMQPEMTTSVLGEEYCDQLLAIERLSNLIPLNWKIYIKENPKQTYYMREKHFFNRLSLIPKVVLVEKSYNTYELIENAKFVATITGTAGWEAISGGKNVLIFGLAWYRSLPGVFKYKSDFNLDEILSYKIIHEELQEKYNELMSKAYDGVLECGYEVIVDNYTNKKNNELLYEAFIKILNKI